MVNKITKEVLNLEHAKLKMKLSEAKIEGNVEKINQIKPLISQLNKAKLLANIGKLNEVGKLTIQRYIDNLHEDHIKNKGNLEYSKTKEYKQRFEKAPMGLFSPDELKSNLGPIVEKTEKIIKILKEDMEKK